jgi:type II secretory pathway pseudopilin PulG
LTLLEIMVVIVIIAVIAAISVPGMLRMRIMANEKGTQTTLRTIYIANDQFRNTDPAGLGTDEYWTGDVAGLYFVQAKDHDPADGAAPIKTVLDDSTTRADLAPLAQGWYGTIYHNGAPSPSRPKTGYWFVMVREYRHPSTGGRGDAVGSDFAVFAPPARSGRTGNRAFLLASDSAIYYRPWSDLSAETVIEAGEYAKADAAVPAMPTDLSEWSLANR